MTEDMADIHVVGFEEGEMAQWPQTYGLNPHLLTWEQLYALPDDTPVVGHARSGAQLTRSLEDSGKANPIILYVPLGQEVPRGAYYDIKIGDQDLSGLRDQLAHPQLFRMAILADRVPLRLLSGPIERLNVRALDLPAEDAAHIEQCEYCKPALIKALRSRVGAYQLISCPAPEVIAAFALQRIDADGQISRHVESCPFCKPQVEALRQAYGLPGIWVQAGVASRVGAALGRAVDHVGYRFGSDFEAVAEWWRNLGRSFGPALPLVLQLSQSEAHRHSRRTESLSELLLRLVETDEGQGKVEGEQEPEQVPLAELRDLLGGGSMLRTQVAGKGEVTLSWDPVAEALTVELRDRRLRRLKDFSVELRRAGRLVKRVRSDEVEGTLVLSPSDIQENIQRDEALYGAAENDEYSLSIVEGRD